MGLGGLANEVWRGYIVPMRTPNPLPGSCIAIVALGLLLLPVNAPAVEASPAKKAPEDRRQRLEFLATGVAELCAEAQTWTIRRSNRFDPYTAVGFQHAGEEQERRNAEDVDLVGSYAYEREQTRRAVVGLRENCQRLQPRLARLLREPRRADELSPEDWQGLTASLDQSMLRFMGVTSLRREPVGPCYKNHFEGAQRNYHDVAAVVGAGQGRSQGHRIRQLVLGANSGAPYDTPREEGLLAGAVAVFRQR